jgi:hypothetical protein
MGLEFDSSQRFFFLLLLLPLAPLTLLCLLFFLCYFFSIVAGTADSADAAAAGSTVGSGAGAFPATWRIPSLMPSGLFNSAIDSRELKNALLI